MTGHTSGWGAALARCSAALLAFGVLMGADSAAWAQSAERAALLGQGEEAVAYVRGAECPAIDARTPVPGLETRELQLAQLGRRWSELVGHLQAVNQIEAERQKAQAELAGKTINERTQRALAALEGSIEARLAQGAVSFAGWWIAIGAHMREIEADYAPDAAGAHPLTPYAANLRNIEKLFAPHRTKRGFDRFLAPIEQRYLVCLITVQKQVVDHNETLIRRRLGPGGAVEQLNARQAEQAIPGLVALQAKYDVVGKAYVVADQDLTPLVMRELETRRRELQVIIDRERDASARARFEQEQARLAALRQETLRVAQAFVRAANAGDNAATERLMAEDIVFSAPQRADVRGRDKVIASIQGNNSSPTRIEEPRLVEDTLAQANSFAKGTAIRMMLRVSNGLVTSIEVRQR